MIDLNFHLTVDVVKVEEEKGARVYVPVSIWLARISLKTDS